VLDFGFGNAIIRYTSKLLAQGNVKKMYEMFGMFIILYSLIGLISFITGMFIYYNLDYFHGYVNKIYDAWASILTYNFKRLISIYNREHDLFLYKENQRKEEMLRMATQMATEDMLGDLADLEVGTSMSSLINSIKKSGISKKGPSKKKLKK
jgi:hypothetical protein